MVACVRPGGDSGERGIRNVHLDRNRDAPFRTHTVIVYLSTMPSGAGAPAARHVNAPAVDKWVNDGI